MLYSRGMKLPFRAACAASVAVSSAIVLVACIGDTPTVTPGADAATQDSAVADASAFDVTVNDAATLDASSDACSNAPVGNVFQMPSTGFFQPGGKVATPLVSGDYVLTNGFNGTCSGCNVVGATASGGLRITLGGSSAVLERKLTYTAGSDAPKTFVDRFSTTYDPVKKVMVATPVCPTAGSSVVWNVILPANDAGPTNTIEIMFSNDIVAKQTNDAGTVTPTFIFTRQ
ncbi:hypothetical protein BH09MYX1_BH09MYX1_14760 [soil metagenome]